MSNFDNKNPAEFAIKNILKIIRSFWVFILVAFIILNIAFLYFFDWLAYLFALIFWNTLFIWFVIPVIIMIWKAIFINKAKDLADDMRDEAVKYSKDKVVRVVKNKKIENEENI